MSEVSAHKIYGRQKGRPLKDKLQALLETLLPQVAYTLGECRPSPFFLEIGFGGGEHLSFQASLYPERNFLGCEPFINGVASLLREIDEKDLKNILVHHGDVRDVLDQLPNESLDGVCILFPDPWPKKRHHKRRIISPDNLKRLVEVMRPGSYLRVASDHVDYGEWIAQHLDMEKGLKKALYFETGDIHRPQDWPQTRYELKGLGEDRPSRFFIYQKI